MPRLPRVEVEDGIHHVYARGNRKQPLFLCDDDYADYVGLLGRVARRKGWWVRAYCLMPNHVHLLIETPDCNLGPGMQHLHGLHARVFNDRHGLVGHAFQGRFGSTLVTTEGQLLMVARYLARNPVAAGLCAEPDGWPWSSYARLAAGTAPHWLASARLYEYVADWGGDPRARIDALVALDDIAA